MSKNRIRALVGCALVSVQWLVPPSASAVGGGIPFVFREGAVAGAMQHPVNADSMDFTYHACLHFTDADSFRESGYFWISSFQDVAGVVDAVVTVGAGLRGFVELELRDFGPAGTAEQMRNVAVA